MSPWWIGVYSTAPRTMERGTEVDAIVVAEAIVDPEKAVSAEVLPEIGTVMDIEKYKFGNPTSADIKFDIEREKNLKQMTFEVKPVAGVADLAGALKGLKLIAVDGVAAPESVAAVSATSHSATFDGWSILRFCRDGETTLRFWGTNGSGETVGGSIQMHVKIKKKA